MTLRKRTVNEEQSMARWSVHEHLKLHGPCSFKELSSTGLCEVSLKRALVQLVERKAIRKEGVRYVMLDPKAWVR